MPRKNPVSATDLAIGKRLAHLRMGARISREELAVRAGGLSPGLIARVELGRMPLRYKDARHWLQGLGGGNFLAELSPINPFWLAEGTQPPQLAWPLFLPEAQAISLNPNISFSQFVAMFRSALIGLCKYPPEPRLPESWLAPYLSHLVSLIFTAARVESCTRLFENALVDSAETLAPNSADAAYVLTEHQNWKSTEGFRMLIESRKAIEVRGGEKSLLTYVVSSDNISAMQDQMLKLRARLIKATVRRGQKAALAKWLKVPMSSISPWFAGRKQPSGETTLRLVQWVDQWEAQQKQSPGGVSPPPEPKTQSKAASNEKKPKSGRAKH
jgi:transcriptional regulator with XRE-family HTH domain